MKIGVIFHRPEIIDSGWARKILTILSKFGWYKAKICGTMGTIALIDNYMDHQIVFDFRSTIECLAEMAKEFDTVVIAAYSNNSLKSHAFCWHLVKKLDCPEIPIIEVEAKNRIVINWCKKSNLSLALAEELGFNQTSPPDFEETMWIENGIKYRRILAVEKGDFVLINGVVVGRSTSDDVVLKEFEGEVIGGDVLIFKDHGLAKLSQKGKIDLFNAKVNTTNLLRRTKFKRRYFEKSLKQDLIIFIDHGVTIYSGANIYEEIKNGISGAVTIGDDTTSIAGDILSRFKIPIIGIVDGDQDGLLKSYSLDENSVVLSVKNDDQFGRIIYDEIFKRVKYLNSNFKEIKEKVISFAISLNQLTAKKEGN
ncbi:MAG: DUF2117 domain-containing protein [Candidatus Methylarchaceae archaeon HK02M1]|nr:DUF2117 domain-containing protein [Candidatus Methylarchaceae archaeon HK02M1]